jgi:GDP-mannose transporter
MRYASRNIKIPRMGMIFYNNLLSAIFLVPLTILCNEIPTLSDPDFMNSQFILMNTIAGCLGAGLNFASLWCVSATSATTYAIVGTLNKIPVTILGFYLFETAITREGIIFISMATLGGVIYGYSKLPPSRIR